MVKDKERILEIAGRLGVTTAADVQSAGISRNHLYELCKAGKIERTARGLYRIPGALSTEHGVLIEVAKRVPKGVVCLLSALRFHDLTTQISHEVWITVPRGGWRPQMDYPPLNLTYVSGEAYAFGIREHAVQGIAVKVYTPAKTVADCFKFRNKVGLDVAIEALREAWRSRLASMDDLAEAAKVCRVFAVMRPYLEATV
jgi:predicted transcriptional regulator of viral defense system